MSSATDFLQGTDWRGAKRVPLAGDASTRRYERLLSSSAGPAILMITPAVALDSAQRFVDVANFLTKCGYSAPAIYATDMAHGLLLLEDLGDDLFAALLGNDAGLEQTLYEAAVDFLVDLHSKPPPPDLARFDGEMLSNSVDIAETWYANSGRGDSNPALFDEFSKAFERVTHLTDVIVLRDFHAENLIWLPDRAGHARVGLLDFQDALMGHRAYDLVSLLQDARRDVPAKLADTMISRYTNATGVEDEAFRLAYSTLGAQRNLRILGVFARLSLAEEKSRYTDFIPRVWGHLMSCLTHPELVRLGATVLDHIPAPNSQHLARLRPA